MFKVRIKTRIYTMAAYIILGAVMCALKLTGTVENNYLWTWGIALVVCGTVHLIRNIRIIKNPERLREIEIAEKDERNIMLWEKARSLTFTVYILAAGIAVITLFLLNMAFAGQILSYTICGFLLTYVICYAIIKRKY